MIANGAGCWSDGDMRTESRLLLPLRKKPSWPRSRSAGAAWPGKEADMGPYGSERLKASGGSDGVGVAGGNATTVLPTNNGLVR